MTAIYSISEATLEDIPALVTLINSAYRGEGSKKGWTTEADLLEGELRTDKATLTEIIVKAGASILQYKNNEGVVAGCVYLQEQEQKLYLGMLTVSPDAQGLGIGKKLLEAARILALDKKRSAIFMNVISLRTELIAWYERHGYKATGERKPFPEDNRFGRPTRPLEFIIMEQAL